MGTVWIKEFVGGLDTRRMQETTSGGVLVKAENGHITRGGEFEKRAAFVPEYALPAGTIGLAATQASIYVFGHEPTPGGLPPGVSYQQLQHPDGVTALTRALSWDLFAGKLYVVGVFADGSVFHFYDGSRILDWYDGKARASFEVVSGQFTGGALGSYTVDPRISAGDVGDTLTSITIDGIELLAAPVSYSPTPGNIASAMVSSINARSDISGFQARLPSPPAVDNVVIETVSSTDDFNGEAIIFTTTGIWTIPNGTINGGIDPTPSRLTDLQVAGVSIIAAPVNWTSTTAQMAADIAAAINAHVSVPNYEGFATGNVVTIVAVEEGSAPNGRLVTAVVADGLVTDIDANLIMDGGGESGLEPGTFVKTVGQKMYSLSGPNTHFSGIKAPTRWTTDAIGAGFIDMSTESSGSENLIALGRYQNFVVIFAERVIQIWFFDPDPSLNRQVQVLNNTGTVSAHSVTQFGDNDLFYLDESGLRSVKARDSSNAAATTDIGVPIDPIVIAKLLTLSDVERDNIVGLIEPRDGRFWLIAKDVIYVFSFYNGAKVSAWSTYAPSTVVDDESVTFDVEAAVVFAKRVYLRSGDTIYVYGGLGSAVEYDATVADAWLPFLDANDPTRKKEWNGVDAALVGEWEVRYALEPNDPTAEDLVATLFRTTYTEDRVPSLGGSTHISPRFRTKGDGYAKLSAVVLHYAGDTDED